MGMVKTNTRGCPLTTTITPWYTCTTPHPTHTQNVKATHASRSSSVICQGQHGLHENPSQEERKERIKEMGGGGDYQHLYFFKSITIYIKHNSKSCQGRKKETVL